MAKAQPTDIRQIKRSRLQELQNISVAREVSNLLINVFSPIEITLALFRAKLANLQDAIELLESSIPASQVPIPGFTNGTTAELNNEVQTTKEDLQQELNDLFNELERQIGGPSFGPVEPGDLPAELEAARLEKIAELTSIMTKMENKAQNLASSILGTGQVVPQDPPDPEQEQQAGNEYLRLKLQLRNVDIPAFLANLNSVLTDFTFR